MDIVVLSKRQYMHKDLLDDRYGRFWEIPTALARAGHDVRGYVLSYSAKPQGVIIGGSMNTVAWESFNAGPVKPAGLLRYAQHVSSALKNKRPDIIWACSDSIYVIVGRWLAKQHDTAFIADLYDNFEAYDSARIPFVRSLYRHALNKADGVTTVSDRLRDKIVRDSAVERPVQTLQNGIPEGLFRPLDKEECRRQWGIPQDAVVIGCTGILTEERGYGFILDVFEALRKSAPGLRLVLAGSRGPGVRIPCDEYIHDLGALPQTDLPKVMACFDIAVINNNQTEFSNYTFPQRLYETLACGIPVLASSVGGVREVFAKHADCLYQPGDVQDFVQKAWGLLNKPYVPAIPVRPWPDLAKELETFMGKVCSDRQS